MKLKYKFIVQNVSGKPVAVAVGKDNERFNGMIKLNDSGAEIFKLLNECNYTQEEIIARIAERFGITEEQATPSLLAFLEQLRQSDLLTE
jgi:hypothetical protein